MARPADGYTRAVWIAKLVLPLMALGLLATLFLLSRSAPGGRPVAPGDLSEAELAREERLGRPSYNGVTEEGARITLAAESLAPDPDRPGVIAGRDLIARVVTAGGYGWDVLAEAGEIDQPERVTTLSGGVRIHTTDGYRLTTERAVMKTNLTWLRTDGAVAAEGPLGQLSAGRMTITGDPETGRGAVLVFQDGVRLVYRPGP